MTGGTTRERRAQLLRILREAERVITGSDLSLTLGVSRQAHRHRRRHLCAPDSHPPDQGREEFEILLDSGIAVLDVGVEHSVFGELRAPISVETRAEVDLDSERIISAGERCPFPSSPAASIRIWSVLPTETPWTRRSGSSVNEGSCSTSSG